MTAPHDPSAWREPAPGEAPAPHKIRLTPQQGEMMSLYDDSESYNAALDAGMTRSGKHGHILTVPEAAVPHLSAFANLHKEIADDYAFEDWKTPEDTAKHRTAKGMHGKIRGVLGDRMDRY